MVTLLRQSLFSWSVILLVGLALTLFVGFLIVTLNDKAYYSVTEYSPIRDELRTTVERDFISDAIADAIADAKNPLEAEVFLKEYIKKDPLKSVIDSSLNSSILSQSGLVDYWNTRSTAKESPRPNFYSEELKRYLKQYKDTDTETMEWFISASRRAITRYCDHAVRNAKEEFSTDMHSKSVGNIKYLTIIFVVFSAAVMLSSFFTAKLYARRGVIIPTINAESFSSFFKSFFPILNSGPISSSQLTWSACRRKIATLSISAGLLACMYFTHLQYINLGKIERRYNQAARDDDLFVHASRLNETLATEQLNLHYMVLLTCLLAVLLFGFHFRAGRLQAQVKPSTT